MAEWKDFVKKAQTWGYFAPAHEPRAAREWHEASTKAVDKAIDGTRSAFNTLGRGAEKVMNHLVEGAYVSGNIKAQNSRNMTNYLLGKEVTPEQHEKDTDRIYAEARRAAPVVTSGMIQGIGDIIPGTVDLLGGLAGGLGYSVAGGKFGEGFNAGREMIAPGVENLHDWQGFLGGDAATQAALEDIARTREEYRQRLGLPAKTMGVDRYGMISPEELKYLDTIIDDNGIRDTSAALTQFFAGAPVYGRAFQGLGTIGSAPIKYPTKALWHLARGGRSAAPLAAGAPLAAAPGRFAPYATRAANGFNNLMYASTYPIGVHMAGKTYEQSNLANTDQFYPTVFEDLLQGVRYHAINKSAPPEYIGQRVGDMAAVWTRLRPAYVQMDEEAARRAKRENKPYEPVTPKYDATCARYMEWAGRRFGTEYPPALYKAIKGEPLTEEEMMSVLPYMNRIR